MNREAGLEYGFSWLRRAAAVAAAGTLSLSLVGCEKPADEQQMLRSQKLSARKTPLQLMVALMLRLRQNTQT